MLDEKKINESRKRVEELIRKGELIKEKSGRFTEFFITNSKNSFDSARLLYEASTNQKLQNNIGFSDFNGFLWVINASYYSMFYMTRALLENNGVKIKTNYSIHIATFDALVYYFYITKKIERLIVEELEAASKEVDQTLGKEKARDLIEDYSKEREKRGQFTYEMGVIAMQNKAKTSLERARHFNESLRKMIL